jgi:hypothetical protein
MQCIKFINERDSQVTGDKRLPVFRIKSTASMPNTPRVSIVTNLTMNMARNDEFFSYFTVFSVRLGTGHIMVQMTQWQRMRTFKGAFSIASVLRLCCLRVLACKE